MRDHGPGVPEEELDSLFRPFFRGSNAASADGHGLGLAIVQRVVTIHGGTLTAGQPRGRRAARDHALPLASVVAIPNDSDRRARILQLNRCLRPHSA